MAPMQAIDPRLKQLQGNKKFFNSLAGNSILTPNRRFFVSYSVYGNQAPQYNDQFYFAEDKCKVTPNPEP